MWSMLRQQVIACYDVFLHVAASVLIPWVPRVKKIHFSWMLLIWFDLSLGCFQMISCWQEKPITLIKSYTQQGTKYSQEKDMRNCPKNLQVKCKVCLMNLKCVSVWSSQLHSHNSLPPPHHQDILTINSHRLKHKWVIRPSWWQQDDRKWRDVENIGWRERWPQWDKFENGKCPCETPPCLSDSVSLPDIHMTDVII